MGRRAFERHTVALYGKEAVARREPLAVGVDVATGARLFAKSEDYILLVGVPRVGKGEGFVIPAVLRHKGPAVVTATRHDTYMDTGSRPGQGGTSVRLRSAGPGAFGGEAAVEPGQGMRDTPDGHLAGPRVRRLRRGRACRRRGRGLLGAGRGARSSAPISTPLPSRAGRRRAPRLVTAPGGSRADSHPGAPVDAAGGWDEDLATSAEVEPRHRDSIWATVRRAFDCFADPMVLDATRVGGRHVRSGLVSWTITGRST